jgi:hypothetical protein
LFIEHLTLHLNQYSGPVTSYGLRVSKESSSKAETIAKADAAWKDWHAFLVEEANAGRVGQVGTDGWTLAEAVAHVARWQDWAAGQIRAILAGERVERVEVEAKNAEWAAADREIDFATALIRMDEAWTGLRAAAESVPDDKWRRMVAAIFVANTWEHYEEHLAWRTAA